MKNTNKCHVFTHPAERLEAQWSGVESSARGRHAELEDMLTECGRFDDRLADLDHWLTGVEGELAMDTPANINTQRLRKQNKVGNLGLGSWYLVCCFYELY